MVQPGAVRACIGVMAGLLLWGAAPERATGAPAPTVRRYALVVGNNFPLPGHDYESLQYADDDALHFAAFMQRLGAEVRVLVGPDAASAQRYPELSKRSLPPRRAQLLRALEDLERDLVAAEGGQREVYVYFSGHGSVTSSKAYLHLLDAPFTRTDLHSLVLDRLSAERLHVIIDSCHSYFLVNDRGERVPAPQDETDLGRYPRAGFMLSTSAKKEVQEWSGYEAGVFSYQLLGAMQGAADVNMDGLVTYAEAHAYLIAANIEVENPAARVQPFVRRPAVGDAVLVDLRGTESKDKLHIPDELSGHFYVVDGHGQRLLDANKPQGQAMAVLIPPKQDLLLWSGVTAYGVTRDRGEPRFTRSSTVAAPKELTARGTVADELRRNLFRRPLTSEFVAGLDAAVSFGARPRWGVVKQRAPGPAPVSIGLFAGGAAAGLAGAIATGLFVQARQQAQPAVFTAQNIDAVEAARARADVSRAVMVSGYTAGLTLVGAGLLYELLSGTAAPLQLQVGPQSVGVGARW